MRLPILAALICVAGCATPGPGSATEPAAIAAAVAAADRPAEDRALDASRRPAEMLAFAGLEKGDRVLDFTGGAGYYAEIASGAVGPTGQVTIFNPPGFAGRVAEVVAKRSARLPNIEMVAAHIDEMVLPANHYDLTIFHLVYHDLYWESTQYQLRRSDPARALAKLFAATKPGGAVLVIDHVAAPGRETRAEVEVTHRIDPATIRADFAAAGFTLAAESPLLRVAGDDLTKNVFDPAIRGRTDRVAYRFVRPR